VSTPAGLRIGVEQILSPGRKGVPLPKTAPATLVPARRSAFFDHFEHAPQGRDESQSGVKFSVCASRRLQSQLSFDRLAHDSLIVSG